MSRKRPSRVSVVLITRLPRSGDRLDPVSPQRVQGASPRAGVLQAPEESGHRTRAREACGRRPSAANARLRRSPCRRPAGARRSAWPWPSPLRAPRDCPTTGVRLPRSRFPSRALRAPWRALRHGGVSSWQETAPSTRTPPSAANLLHCPPTRGNLTGIGWPHGHSPGPRRLSARLPGHLRDARDRGGRARHQGGGRSRPSDHGRLPVRQGLELPGSRLFRRAHPPPAGPRRARRARAASGRRAGTRRSTSWRPGCARRATSTGASRSCPTRTPAPRA